MRNELTIVHSDDYRILFNSIDEGISIIEKSDTSKTSAGNTQYVISNPAFERITGLTDVIGKTAIDVLPGATDSIMDIYDNIVRTGKPNRYETYNMALERWFSAYAFPLGEPDLNRVATILLISVT